MIYFPPIEIWVFEQLEEIIQIIYYIQAGDSKTYT